MAVSKGKKKPSGGQVPVPEIRELVELMKEYELEEIYWRDGERRIRLRKQGAAPSTTAVPTYPVSPPYMTPPVAPPAAPPQSVAGSEPAVDAEPPSAQSEDSSNYVPIKSPMVGTFYAAPAPDKPPFVEVGSHVEPDTIVCLIEAMKVFNEIPAEVSGTIVKILVENGQPVEYGQTLFLVDPSN